MEIDKNVYREEAYELLDELTETLLELEQGQDEQLVGRAFRALHTIKGSGAMFGFEELAAFVHDIETVYDKVRDGKLSVNKPIIDLTLAACDIIRAMVSPDGDPVDETEKGRITAGFAALLEHRNEPAAETAAAAATDRDEPATYRIRFRPDPHILLSGTNPILLLNELRDMGQITVCAQTGSLPTLDSLCPEECYVCWDIILTTDAGLNAVRDVFIFVEDGAEVHIDVLDTGHLDEAAHKKLGEILVERGDIDADSVSQAISSQLRVGELLVSTGKVPEGSVASALAEQAHMDKIRNRRQQTETVSSVRVAAEKIDGLVDLVGEMVTVQARLTQLASQAHIPELNAVAEEVERLTAELRDNTMSIRMMPIGPTFSKFKRTVRDLSNELGKEVVLETSGAATELDKTVIERLGDPLMHLVRNSIDHGIESPEERRSTGKSPQGTIRLAARHSGAYVVIEVSDDGAGLDAERILAKATERGIIKQDAQLSDREIYDLIFAPGFSTAARVSSVSGRGVGMDVVRQNVDALRGTIEVGSKKGLGTTITLKLPLTLAIIDGLLVRIAQNYFVLPLAIVEECMELTRRDIQQAHGKHMAHVRGDLVPYLCLRENFGTGGVRPDVEQIVICGIEDQRVGFVVDAVIGGHQTVIKNLGRMYRDIEGLSGATILGDGTVALILDPPKLIQQVEHEVATLQQ